MKQVSRYFCVLTFLCSVVEYLSITLIILIAQYGFVRILRPAFFERVRGIHPQPLLQASICYKVTLSGYSNIRLGS